MRYHLTNEQKLLEIIFADRNKEYGAYEIRSAYGTTVLRALTITTSAVALLFLCAWYFTNRPLAAGPAEATIPIEEQVVICTIDPRILPPPPPPPGPRGRLNAGVALSHNIVDSTTVETSTASTVETTEEGNDTTATVDVQGNTGTGTIPGTVAAVSNTVPEIFIIADKNPEFEGGLPALYAFLGSRLKYPAPALEAYVEGTVYVKFVVDETGKVEQLSTLNKLGYGLDQEALRVVGSLPKFKSPGIVKNKPVKVYFQLPIKFKIR